MKNLIFSIFLCFPSFANSQTIQEFYELFEHSERKSAVMTKENDVLIDKKNAFIRIQSRGQADDAVSFKYFVKEDKSKIFGFQYSASQPDLGLMMWRTEFYVYKDKKWQEVTQEVCPSLGFEDFWGNQPLPTNLLQEFNLELSLPQKGNVILAKSNPAIGVQFPYSNLPKEYTETFEKRKFKTIELNWNKKTGKFEIGKKY